MNLRQSLLNRLLKRRIVTDNNCWIMLTPSGKIKRELHFLGRNHLVNRVSAFIHLDFDLYSNDLICHTCKTKFCWNPEHIYIGNTSTNTLDAVKDGTFKNPNTNKEFCKHGHKLSGLNLYIWKDYKTGQIHRWCRACRTRHSINYNNKR